MAKKSNNVEQARVRAHASLAHSERLRLGNLSRLKAIANAAKAKVDDLSPNMEELAQAADTAVGEERDVLHRRYLAAQQTLYRCNQVYHRARRALALAMNQ